MTRTTDEGTDRFNQAFRERDATLLTDHRGPLTPGHEDRTMNTTTAVRENR